MKATGEKTYTILAGISKSTYPRKYRASEVLYASGFDPNPISFNIPAARAFPTILEQRQRLDRQPRRGKRETHHLNDRGKREGRGK